MKHAVCAAILAAALLAPAALGADTILLETWESAPEATFTAASTAIPGSDVAWTLLTFAQTGTAIVTKTGALASLNRVLDLPGDSGNNANQTKLTYALPTPIDADTKRVILSLDYALDVVNADGQPSCGIACGGYSFNVKRNDLAAAVAPNDNRISLFVNSATPASASIVPGETDAKTPALDTIYHCVVTFEKLSATETKVTSAVTSPAHNLLSYNETTLAAALNDAEASLSNVTVTFLRRFKSCADNIKIQTEDIMASVGDWRDF